MTSLIAMVKQTDVDAQLQRILASQTFAGSPRSTQFLLFCVRHGFGEKTIELKETTIAVEVFKRSPDYNPKSDPIVRVQARRVREKLDEYYRVTGNDDPIRIDLPKGGYVPRISRTLPSRKTDFMDWAEPSLSPPQRFDVQKIGARPARKEFTRAMGFWLLSILLVSISVAFLWRDEARAKSIPASSLLLQPLTLPDHVSDPAWSPDGSRLAFTSTDSSTGVTHVYLYTPGRGTSPVRLTQGETPEMRPVWSPDGLSVAFIRSLDLSHFEIVCQRLQDNNTKTFGPFNAMAYVTQEHAALDWSPDGSTLLSTEQMSPSSPMRLVLISMATGERAALTSPPSGSTGDINGKFSPDGKWVAFRRGGLGDLYVVSIKGEQDSAANRLTYDMSGVRGIAWCDNGRSILFGTNKGPTNRFGIWKIPMAGGVPEEVTPADFDAVDPTVSRDGSLVFAHRAILTTLMSHRLAPDTPDHAVFAPSAIDMAPTLSPNGKLLAFGSTRSGLEQLWIGRIGDAAPTQATHFQTKGLVLFPSWSPDNLTIAFSFRQGAATNIFLYSLRTGLATQITSTRHRDISPVFSADGRYLYYSSNDDGTSRIWRVSTNGSQHPEPMFWEAVTDYLPSSDGKWMYFVEGGQSFSLLRINLQDGTSEQIFHSPGNPTFTKDIVTANGSIYVAVSTNDNSQADVFQITPDTKRTRLVTHLNNLPSIELSGFAITPDAKSFIVSRMVRDSSNLYSETLN